jgi:hypothetical protein
MTILGIDPGSDKSAAVMWDGARIIGYGIYDNDELEEWQLKAWAELEYPTCFIEMVQNYGTQMGSSTIKTILWTGRFTQRWKDLRTMPEFATRPTIKTHLCGVARANDSHVREALIDRLGPPGNRKAPGPTFGIASHMWAALAVSVYGYDISKISGKAA